ncbi:CCD62 protein, partial [Odontophorus gujanensis]|nr:CCD62 protein [Odontophorus gujanensis]
SAAEKQRRELQVQYGQLEECGRKLSDVVAVHQCQFLEWINDRQEMLKLAVQCNLLKNELKEKNEVEKSLIRKLKLLESQNSDSKAALENAQQNFEELTQKVTCATLHCQGVEEENQSLHSSVLELSARIDQLQAREQELLTKLKLRDETMLEAADYITEFTSEFIKLENTLHGSMAEELSLNKEKKDLTLRLKELILERNKLKDDLCEQNKENNKQQEEIIHLKRENVSLKNELALNVESLNRKDQLLQHVKSTQVQTDTELSTLQQV